MTEVIDLRTTDEIASAPDPDIEGATNERVRILDESGDDSTAAMTGVYSQNSDNPAASLLEMYRAGILSDTMYTSMFDNETALKGYREFVDKLLAHDDGAILWHCTGGKDRAGTAAVIALTLLGVDKETVLDDFELTNQFNAKSIEYMKSNAAELTDDQNEIEGVAMLTGVSRQLMENLFDRAESENGSMLEFLKAKLNITDDEIAILTQQVSRTCRVRFYTDTAAGRNAPAVIFLFRANKVRISESYYGFPVKNKPGNFSPGFTVILRKRKRPPPCPLSGLF